MKNHSEDYYLYVAILIILFCVLSMALNFILMKESVVPDPENDSYYLHDKLFAPFYISLLFSLFWFSFMIVPKEALYLGVAILGIAILIIAIQFSTPGFPHVNTSFPKFLFWFSIILSFTQPVPAAIIAKLICIRKDIKEKQEEKAAELQRIEQEKRRRQEELERLRNRLTQRMNKIRHSIDNISGEEKYKDAVEEIRQLVEKAERKYSRGDYRATPFLLDQAEDKIKEIFGKIDKHKKKYTELTRQLDTAMNKYPGIHIDDIKKLIGNDQLDKVSNLLEKRKEEYKKAKGQIEILQQKITQLRNYENTDKMKELLGKAKASFSQGDYNSAINYTNKVINIADDLLLQKKKHEEILKRITNLIKKEENIYVEDIKHLLEQKNIDQAMILIEEREKKYSRFAELQDEITDINKKMANLADQLADEKISSSAFEKARDDLEREKKEIEEELWKLRSKLFKEEYEKPF